MSLDIEMQAEILLSIVNTRLRDYYPSLKEMALRDNFDIDKLKEKLKKIDYEYDENLNKFI